MDDGLKGTLSDLIRKTRVGSGIQQQSLADTVGVTRTTISNIENERQALTLDMFCRIARALNEEPGSFLTRAINQKVEAKVTHEEIGDEKIRDIINKYVGGSNHEQETN